MAQLRAIRAKIDAVQIIIGYNFNQPDLLWEALSLGGLFRTIGGRDAWQGNLRLAIIGDAAAKYCLSMDWYPGGTTIGTWGSQSSHILSDRYWAQRCRATGLINYLIMDPFNPLRDISIGVAGTLFEAVIGAVAVDGSLNDVQTVMQNLGVFWP